jgi:hypothetical protein
MRSLLCILALLAWFPACRHPPRAAPTPHESCWRDCHERCTQQVRSELISCRERCHEECDLLVRAMDEMRASRP